MTTVIERRVHRRGTAAAWTTANPVLLAGEVGYETDTHKTKLGDGATNWVTLPYDAPNATVLSSTYLTPAAADLAYDPAGSSANITLSSLGAASAASLASEAETARAAEAQAEITDGHRLASGEATIPRRLVTNQAVTMNGSGAMLLTYFTASKTETVNNMRLVTGSAAAAATPTLVRAGAYTVGIDATLTLVASIASDTAIFSAANASYTRALIAPLAKEAGQRYAIGILVVTGAATPTLCGGSFGQASEAGIPPRLSGIVTGQANLPATIAPGSIGDNARGIYVVLTP